MKRHKTVDDYIAGNPFRDYTLIKLRQIILSTELQETIKWGAPVYTFQGKNIVGLGAYKSYVGIWFFQGALLSDIHRKLVNAQEGKTKALRQWRFNSIEEINAELILEYLDEAIQNQKSGKEIKPAKRKPLVVPVELQDAFDQNTGLKNAFELLGLSKQREFADYISEAKREETRIKRLDKVIPLMLAQKGLHDKYR